MPRRAFYKDLKKKFRLLAGLTLLYGYLAAGAAIAQAPAAPAAERLFYKVSIGGAPAGRLLATLEKGGERRTTSFDLELLFQRAGLSQSLGMQSRFVETAAGEPIEAWSRQLLGSAPIETTYRFKGAEIEIESRQGDNLVRRSVPNKSGWQTPQAAEEATTKAMAAALAGGPTRFSITSLDPLLGPEPGTTWWELEARDEKLELDGRSFRTSRWKQTQDVAPQVPSIVWLDETGEIRRSRTELAGMDMMIEWTATEPPLEAAPAYGESKAGGGPEVMVNTFLRPDRPLEEARSLRRAVYRLRGADLALPDLGCQRVEPEDGGLRITVDLAAPREEGLEAEDLAPYLRASIFVNHQNPKVRELYAKAIATAQDEAPAPRAERLRTYVNRYLEQKDLSSVLATASEVAESASGDCTEHAVLLAALLRAGKIPSRVVFGLIYVDSFAGERGIFGYHMWTQAYLDGRFVDLDATLPQPFDAAHISLGASPLEEEQSALAAMNNAMQTLSKAKLLVVEPVAPPPQ